MKTPTIPPTVRNRLAFWALAGLALFVAHDAVFLAQIGPGQALVAELRTAGHGYWTSASLLLIAVSVVAGLWTWRRVRHLRRRASSLDAAPSRDRSFDPTLRERVGAPCGPRRSCVRRPGERRAPDRARTRTVRRGADRAGVPARAAGHRPRHRDRRRAGRARRSDARGARRRDRSGAAVAELARHASALALRNGFPAPPDRSSHAAGPAALLLHWPSSESPERTQSNGARARARPGRNHDPSHRTGRRPGSGIARDHRGRGVRARGARRRRLLVRSRLHRRARVHRAEERPRVLRHRRARSRSKVSRRRSRRK